MAALIRGVDPPLGRLGRTTFTVEAGRPIELTYGGWAALGAELAEQNADLLRIDLMMNGQPITGYRLPAETVERVRRRLAASGLAARFDALSLETTGCFETWDGRAHAY